MISHLFWNIRGIASKASLRRLKSLVRMHSVSVLVLLEPLVHINKIEEFRIKLGFTTALASATGRIWIFGNNTVSFGHVDLSNDQVIHVELSYLGLDPYILSAVYAKSTRSGRAELWNSLVTRKGLLGDAPWLVGGDFNVVRFSDECSGGAPLSQSPIQDFNDCIQTCELMELQPTGLDFTWEGSRSTGRLVKKLDRLLFSDSWFSLFPRTMVENLNRTTSDHCPMLLNFAPQLISSPKPFRFQDMWLLREGFGDLVRSNWSQPISTGGMLGFALKLRRLKICLKTWNREVFGNIVDRVKELEDAVFQKEHIYDSTSSPSDREELHRAKAELLSRLKEREEFLRQKSRMRWLTDGDSNSAFFHATIRGRNARHGIYKIAGPDGEWITEPSLIAGEAIRFFSSIFAAEIIPDQEEAQSHFLDFIPSLISPEDNASLLAPITLSELQGVVFGLSSDSAPGPDGFSGRFFTKFWDLISSELLDAVTDFLAGAPMPKAVASVFLTLIPKKLSVVSFTDYRPISLCNFLNKVFTRLLTGRLKPLLPNLISSEQSAFLPGRDISDNILLAQDLTQLLDHKARGSNVILKLDMMKAFDRVSWSFMRKILISFGFSNAFVALVMGNLSASWFSILINGSPCGYFQASRGIKQGDPLSPYLFILVSEALSRGLNFYCQAGRIDYMGLPAGARCISHLSFADDVVLFTTGRKRSLENLDTFFKTYESATGQKINRAKSAFYISDSVSPHRTSVILSALGVPRGEFPFLYLGCGIYKGRRTPEPFHHLLSSIDQKLSSWKNRLLSMGGRIILIRHVLSAIPLHTIGTLEPPKSIFQLLHKRFQDFLWGEGEYGPKRHWRSWHRLCFPTSEGGLGFRNLMDVVRSFACKLWWKYVNRLGLWADFLHTLSTTTKLKTSSWRRILAIRMQASTLSHVKVNNGECSFWFDNWRGGGILAVTNHPPMEHLSVASFVRDRPTISASLVMYLDGDIIADLNDYTLPDSAARDVYTWHPTPHGDFSISSAYHSVRSRVPITPIWRILWQPVIPLRISFFIWKAYNNLLPLPNTMCRMGFSMAPSICSFCGAASESLQHIFLTCPFSTAIWNHFAALVGAPGINSNGLWSSFFSWQIWAGRSSIRKLIGALLPVLIVWNLWKMRNKNLYEGIRADSESLIRLTYREACELLMARKLEVTSILESNWVFDRFNVRPTVRKRRAPLVLTWPISHQGGVVLHSDGSVSPDGAGWSFVLRGGQGNFIFAATGSLGTTSSLEAEVLAMLEGLRFCQRQGYGECIVRTDCNLLLQLLNSRRYPWKLTSLFQDIEAISSTLSCSFRHVYRELNVPADLLARSGAASPSQQYVSWSTLPSRVRGALLLDMTQFPHIRIR